MRVVRMHERFTRPAAPPASSAPASTRVRRPRPAPWIGGLALALLLCLVATPAAAQSLFGSLSGTVTDAQGGVLPGASVSLTDQASRTAQTTVTNEQGVFVFAAVPAATYAVKVEMQGFNSWEATDVNLRLGERRQITGIVLSVGNLSETVSVTSRPEIAPLESGE